METRSLAAYAAALLAAGLAAAPPPQDPYTLELAAPVDRGDEAVPLGNGLVGALLWGAGNELRLSLDRGDLWDLRPHPAYARAGLNYATMVQLARWGQQDVLKKEYSGESDLPTKIPGVRLTVALDAKLMARSFRLDMRRGTGIVDYGGASAEALVHATEPVVLVFLPGGAPRLDLTPHTAPRKLGGYPPYTAGNDKRSAWLVQDGPLGLRYAVYASFRPVAGGHLLAVAYTTQRDGDPEPLARQRVRTALDAGHAKLRAAHEQWWQAFWAQSSVQIPDAVQLQQYNLAEYFYGAASRRGAPPIAPPGGAYRNGRHTATVYSAHLAAGHFEEGRSLTDFLWSVRTKQQAWSRSFYGLQRGMLAPGLMALDGTPMGAPVQSVLAPAQNAWLAQSFYLQWRYEMDTAFLTDRAYPYCSGVGEALAALLQSDPRTGRPKLPLNWNEDETLLPGLFAANAEMAAALGKNDEASRWRELSGRFGDEVRIDAPPPPAGTLAGKFAAAHAVQEMLLASRGGLVQVFPAAPDAWADASFEDLRAAGGFAISAERRAGRTVRVTIKARAGEPLRLKNPFAGEFTASLPVAREEGQIRATLQPGQTLELRAR